MFGFTVFSSISQAVDDGKIQSQTCKESKTTGALLIRNSWGEGGYGWLPYEYVLQGMAVDWWTLLKSEWVATGQFEL